MTGALAATAFMLLASAGEAIHSDPAPGDNLRLYTLVDAPVVTFVLDGRAPSRFPGMSVMFTRVAPGHHQASVALPNGARVSLAFTVSADNLIASKGRRWWCLMTSRRRGALTMLRATTAQCKAITDAGPD